MKRCDFLAFIEQHNIAFIDFRFTDIAGVWHHMTFTASAVTETVLAEGIYFDGSSIHGWRAIHESDMLLQPDLSKFFIDPFMVQPTVAVVCDVYDPGSKQSYDRDPRSIAKRAEAFLITSKIASKAYFGPEPEFFIFDNIRYETSSTAAFYEIESDEFPQSNARTLSDGNHGHRPRPKGAYFPLAPLDSLHDMRAEMCTSLAQMGLDVEKHHHEVAPAQHEIGFKYSELVDTADNVQIYKYGVHNVADSYGKTATFMPKPIFGDNGSGMHVHQSLWLEGAPLFAGDLYSGLSETALYYIGGILHHARAINAFSNPSTNSYKRLVPGYEAPVMLAYSASNRSAACRIPLADEKNAKRIEIRFPDPQANPYLCFAALLMAGLDGIRNKISPGNAMDVDLFEDIHAAKNVPTVSSSLLESIRALENDHAFLCEGGVFSKDFIANYCSIKREEAIEYSRMPHPIEFERCYSR